MAPINISVLLSGGGSNFEALANAIRYRSIPAQITQVIASRPTAQGLERAQRQHISARAFPEQGPGSPEKEAALLMNWLQETETDLVVLAGYLRKVPDPVVHHYSHRILNVHPSLIPAFSGPGWYGMNVHRAAWQRGVKVTGATVHFVNEQRDAGPIVLQEPVRIGDSDGPKDIQQKVLEVEHRLLPEAVALFTAGKLRVDGHRVIIDEEVNEE